MKRLSVAFLVCGFLVCGSLAYVQDTETLDATSISKSAFDKLNSYDGYHYTLLMRLSMGQMGDMTVTMKGIRNKTGYSHVMGEAMGWPIEMYQKDGENAMLNPMSQQWELSDAGMMPMGGGGSSPGDILDMFGEEFFANATLESFDDAEVEGIACSVTGMALTPEKIQEMLGENMPPMLGVANVGEGQLRLYIGKEDGLLYRQTVCITMDLEGVLPGEIPGGTDEWEDDDWGEEDDWGEDDWEDEGDDQQTGPDDDQEQGGEEAPGMSINMELTATFHDFGQNLDVQPPPEVIALFEGGGATDETPGESDEPGSGESDDAWDEWDD